MAERRPVRVAVIDSGVQVDHPHILSGQVEAGVAFQRDGHAVRGAGAALDRLGHGTAVTAAIQQWAPEASILPLRVFHDGLQASSRALLAAIAEALGAGAHLVNLSLGTTNVAHRSVFVEAARLAASQGCVLVAAHAVEGVACYPGALEGVLGVGLDWDCPPGSCRLAGGVLLASGHPRPIEGVPQRRNLHGVSFAVANVTGLAARLLSNDPQCQIGRTGTEALRALLGKDEVDQATAKPATRSTSQKLPTAPTA